MKQLFFPVATIVSLVAFMDVVSHKEFNRYDDARATQIESPTINRISSCSFPKPKPEPAIETNIVQTKQEGTKTEAKPGASTVANTKSELKQSAAVKLAADNSNKPAAVPVITPKEAIRINEEAIQILQKKEIIGATNGTESVANKTVEVKSAPAAVPVLTLKEALKANQIALDLKKKKNREANIKRICENVVNLYASIVGNHKLFVVCLFVLIPVLLLLDYFAAKRNIACGKRKGYFSIQRHLYVLSSVSLFVFGLMVFVPWNIYLGNYSEFPFLLSDFLGENFLVLIVFIAWLSAILLVIPPVVSNKLVAIFSGLGLCVYFQAMFMNCFLSEMNGMEPDWGQHQHWRIINAVIWLVIILVPVSLSFFRHRGTKIISGVSSLFLLLEMVATISLFFSSFSAVWERQRSCFPDGRNQFQLSKEKNVVMIVFDATGTGYYEYCFNEAPETKEVFKDFIMYPDMRNLYDAHTIPSLNSIFTGTPIYPANNLKEMLNRSWYSNSAISFYEQIKKAGLSPRLFMNYRKCDGLIGSPEIISNYFSNFVDMDVSYSVDKNKLHHCLAQISSYSALPYIAKQFFFYNFNSFDDVVTRIINDSKGMEDVELPSDIPEFYKKMKTTGMTTDSESPVFAIYYTRGSHPKWFINEKCEYVEEPYDDPLPTIKACILVLSDFIQLLKDNNIYDNTAILVCSDHGSISKIHSTPFDMSLLIKPFNHTSSILTIDDSKALSLDVLPILLQLTCGDEADYSAFTGYRISEIPKERERILYQLVSKPEIPAFLEDNKTKKAYHFNCLREYDFENAETFSFFSQELFKKYIPLNKNAVVDESVLLNL